MTNRVLLGASVAWSALATAAAADVTPEEVWSGMQSAINAAYGGYTAASEEQTGDTLTITDLQVSQTNSDGSFTFIVPSIALSDNGDGTVTVTTSPEYDGQMSITDEDEKLDIDLYIRQIGATMIVSGTPDDMTTTYNAESVAVGLDEMLVNGKKMDDAMFELSFNGMSGTTDLRPDGMEQAYDVENIQVDLGLTDPETGEKVKVDALIDTISFTSNSEGENAALQDFHRMAEAGGSMSFDVTTGSGIMNVSGSADGSPFAVSLKSSGSSTSSNANADGLTYDALVRDVQAVVQVNAFPQPIEVQIAEYSINAASPILPGEGPAPVALGFALRDFTMSDALWDIFDPAKVLPRIPATVAVGLEGDAILKAPLFDPAQSAQIQTMFEEGNPPVTLDNLSLTELEITAAGAMITGTGDMAFDNTDLETFNGFPRPEGKIALRAVGLNGLLDNLGQMGILPPEQLMGPRMMLSMFTVVEAQDTLTSTIEIKEGGQILANGQRIR